MPWGEDARRGLRVRRRAAAWVERSGADSVEYAGAAERLGAAERAGVDLSSRASIDAADRVWSERQAAEARVG